MKRFVIALVIVGAAVAAWLVLRGPDTEIHSFRDVEGPTAEMPINAAARHS